MNEALFAEELVSSVKADFEKRRNARRTLEQQWNLNINFLVKPRPVDLLAEARILRLSRRQAVCEVSLYSAGNENELVAHVTGTYALPM